MLVLDRADHNDLYDFPQVSERIIDFLQRHVPGGG